MNTNLLRTITPEEVDTYHRDGVLLLQNMFDEDWIELLNKGLDVNIKTPTRRSRIWHKDTSGHSMFYDHTAWQGIPEFVNCIEQSPGAKIVAEATRSKSIQVFHEHIFVKEPGTTKPTPWHQDMPYYCVDGEDTGSYWIPLDPITKENTLQIVLGSHKWPKLVRPTRWSNDQPWYDNDTEFMDMPDLESIDHNKMIPDLKIGDAILFNFKTVHGAPGNTSMNRRRAFSMRFIGDDVRYVDRGSETSPPFTGINLKTGATMRKDWFPIVWNS